MSRYYMGIDLGTSSVRAGIFTVDGVLHGIDSREYSIDAPQPGWAEQDTNRWWTAMCDSIAGALTKAGIGRSDIGGVSFSGQMHGTVLLDRDNKPVRPAIIWADSRSETECAAITAELGATRLETILMNRIFPGTQAATVAWLKKHAQDSWRKTRRILTPKDYLRWRMCGLFNAESSDASATLLFDTSKRDWSETVLAVLGIPVEVLPYVVNSDQYVGETYGIEDETGLPDGIPVIMGGGDQACAAFGNGVIDEGSLLVTVGTGGQILAPLSNPAPAPGLSLTMFCHLPETRWFILGATLAAGLSLRWFRDTAAPGMSFDDLVKEAASIEPGARGVVFTPYLAGKRSPDFRPSARGAFTGVTATHTRGHFTRAILEGVAFDLRENLAVMKKMKIVPASAVCSGGVTKSAAWMEILSNTLGLPIEVSPVKEHACFGAALLAAIGAGEFQTIRDASVSLPERRLAIEPDPAVMTRYDELYADYLVKSKDA